jgi:hypothetical protein
MITSFDHFNMPRVVKKACCEDAADLPDSAEERPRDKTRGGGSALHLADACEGSYRSSIATVSEIERHQVADELVIALR